MGVIRKRITASADPHRDVIKLDLRTRVDILAITGEIITAAGASPLVSFRLSDASRDNDSQYDVDLLTDEPPGSNAAGKRVGWQPSVITRVYPNEFNVAVLLRDFNGGVIDVTIATAAV